MFEKHFFSPCTLLSAFYLLFTAKGTYVNISDDQLQIIVQQVVKRIMDRTSMKDLDNHITCEKLITPADWQNDRSIFLGATFNLGHNIAQMLYLRPRNKFEEIGHCYLVGGGTHPGSGLPTIYESARISANLIDRYEK